MNNDELHTDLVEAVGDIEAATNRIRERANLFWVRLNTAEEEALQAGGVNDSWALEVDQLKWHGRERDALLERLKTEGGAIVSSNDLSPMAIALGQAASRMYVDKDGFGFVHVPPQEGRKVLFSQTVSLENLPRKERHIPDLGPTHEDEQ